jgi:hypothetical protein
VCYSVRVAGCSTTIVRLLCPPRSRTHHHFAGRLPPSPCYYACHLPCKQGVRSLRFFNKIEVLEVFALAVSLLFDPAKRESVWYGVLWLPQKKKQFSMQSCLAYPEVLLNERRLPCRARLWCQCAVTEALQQHPYRATAEALQQGSLSRD